jgi:uncharacterized delta-60 repeat protein
MSSGIVLRTGIVLTLVAVSTLSGCGDDDSPVVTGGDAGDASAPDANVSADTDSTETTDDSTSTNVSSSETDGAVTSVDTDAGLSPEASIEPSDASDVSSFDPDSSIDASASTDDTNVSSEDDASADTSDDVDSSEQDSGADDGDAGTDAAVEPPVGWVGLEVGQSDALAIDVSPDGDEGFYGLVFDDEGNFYTVGFGTDTSGEAPDTYLTVTKFGSNGAVDQTFGSDNDGVVRINVAPGGTEVARAIVVQTVAASDAGTDTSTSTSYLVIAGTAQFNPEADGLAAAEQDAVLVRLSLDGELDQSFGTEGIVTLDFNTGNEGLNNQGGAAWVNNDTVWSLSTTLGDRLVIHGSQRAEGETQSDDGGTTPRADSDWLLIRLLADGTPDDSFGTGGKVLLDIGGAGASARSATVLEDGSIVGAGYLSSEVLGQATQQPVLYKVDVNGTFDADFATEDGWDQVGVFHDTVVEPPLRAEAYGAAPQGNYFVTMGYGPSNVGQGLTSDFIALRFTADGVFDRSFGTNGATYLDYAGQGDNGRSLTILPDNTILAIGGGRTLAEDLSTPSDAVLALLTPDGQPIDAFGPNGLRGYDFDGGLTDFFWAGAVSPDNNSVVVVGIKGGVVTDSGTTDSESVVLVLPLTEIAN